ncbi:LTA synthase family protein [Methylobacterium gossipiicola]|uniref:Phosphoglycerol transferase MdoB n=1 Tax=Methylobacterium gossipiicola TaxID=582675 RepID=A0A1I2XK64_9HYPH|nr:alkaline phosphatase family protein [Methylobacterium gossipiicola]SFH13409.1 Phosphoglycerol transferase MdoB [Methylobacterium gossipiicola]
MILLALSVALAVSLAIEAFDGRGVRPVSRRPGDLAVRLGAYALLCAFWFAFSWRPWLAAFSCILTVAILTVVSRLKRGVIGEPLVFSDFALLRQVPRHPELYYTRPLNDPRMAGPILASLAAVALWYAVEPSALPHEPSVAVLAVIALPLALWTLARLAPDGALGLWLTARFPAPDLERDVTRYGLPATILAYAVRWRMERTPRDLTTADSEERDQGVSADDTENRVVVVVQLESFIDPVRLGGPALPVMEIVRTRARQYGRLRVPAHGAYTMRTEHAVLTGRPPESLGFGVFDPYLAGGGAEPTSLARLARRAGFETLFIHPFHRDFFDRAAVMGRLGFGRLVMEENFVGAPRIGPYIGDVALAERVLAEIRARTGPLLVFCVTMENHGPWKPGRLAGLDDPRAQYLHHVAHTGEAVERLIAGLEGLPATLCVFGDHAPSLAACRPGFGGTATDYAVLHFGGDDAAPIRRDLTADALGRQLRAEVSRPEA